MIKAGGEEWWSTLTGRVKAQTLAQAYQDNRLTDELKDSSNYILCSNTKLSLGKDTLVKCKAEIDGKGIHQLSSTSGPSPLSGHVKFKRKLNKASDLRLDCKINQKFLQDDPKSSPPSFSLPLIASVDIGTPINRPSLFRYRAGIRQLVKRHDAAGEQRGRISSNLEMQSEVALMGERNLWVSSSAKSKSEAVSKKQTAAKSSPPLSVPVVGSTAIGPHNPLRQSLSNLLKLNGQRVESLSHGGSRGGANGNGGQSMVHVRPDQIQEVLLDSTQSISRLSEDVQGLTKWLSSGSLVRQLQGNKKGKGLKGRLHSLISDKKGQDEGGSSSRGWSSILPRSHFRVGGIMGLIGRARFELPTSHRLRSGQEVPQTPPQTPMPALKTQGGADRMDTPRQSLPHLIRSSVTDWLQRGGVGQGSLSRSAGYGIHPYACGLASLQLGSMQRNLLSFTRLTAKLDLGLISPETEFLRVNHALTLSCCQQLIGPVRVFCDMRFGLDSGSPFPIEPSSSSSTSIAADGKKSPSKSKPSKVPKSHGMVIRARQGAEDLSRHLVGMRPSLASVTYGLDVGVPGTAGLARLAAWYSPSRKEGMVEIKLF